MSLEYILLGMLGQPATGYDLKNGFEHGASYFWAAEFSQIYPTLNKLQERGWLTSRVEPSAKGPERRVYSRTKKGTEELFQWLRSGPVMGTERFAYIGQLIYMSQLDDLNSTREFLAKVRNEMLAKAKILRAVHNEIELIPGFPASLNEADFHGYLALRIGVESMDGRIRGCEACLEMIQQRMMREATHV